MTTTTAHQSRSSPPLTACGYQDENDINLHIPYVFGSSRPRDLSYLDILPAKLRVYNTRLRSSVRMSDEPSLSDYLRQVRAELNSPENRRHRDRSVDSASRYYVFGSSTPRDLSYLNRIPWEQRIYDVKLGSRLSRTTDKRSKTTSFSSTGSAGGGNGRQHGARRTSSLNMLHRGSPSPNGGTAGKKVEHTTRRLTRSAHEHEQPTSKPTSKTAARPSAGTKSKSSTRSPSTASQGSSQKTPIAKPKPKPAAAAARHNGSPEKASVPVTTPIQVECPGSSPINSTVPSHELATMDTSSPISDEFYVVPRSAAMKSDADVGLINEERMATMQLQQHPNGDHSILKTMEEIHQIITTTESTTKTVIHQEVTQEISQNIHDHMEESRNQLEMATSQHLDKQYAEHMAHEDPKHSPRAPSEHQQYRDQQSPKIEEQSHQKSSMEDRQPPQICYEGHSEPTSPPPIIVVDDTYRPASAEEYHHQEFDRAVHDDNSNYHLEHGDNHEPIPIHEPMHHHREHEVQGDHHFNHQAMADFSHSDIEKEHHHAHKPIDLPPGHDHHADEIDREVEMMMKERGSVSSTETPRSRGSSVVSQ